MRVCLLTAALLAAICCHLSSILPAPCPQVREYKAPSAESGDLSQEQIEQLNRDVKAKKTALEQWSRTAFEEVRHHK